MKTWFNRVALASLVFLAACNGSKSVSQSTPPPDESSLVFLSVTSDANSNPQSVDMAMKLAGFSLDEGRKVVIFFNVKGVSVPTKEFPADFAFQEESSLKTQLAALIARGADVHVCPICMKALGVEKDDLIEGAKVTTRPSLFENIGPDTAVFTY